MNNFNAKQVNSQEYTFYDLTLEHYVTSFLTLKKSGWTKSTERMYKLVLNGLIDYTGDRWPVSCEDIMGFLTHGDMEPVSVRSYFGHIRTFFNHLEKMEIIQDNPVKTIIELQLLPRVQELPPVALDETEISVLFNHLKRQAKLNGVPGACDLAWVRFAYVSGCRSGEIASLTWNDIHLDDNCALIRITKSKKYRKVYFDKTTVEALRKYKGLLEVSEIPLGSLVMRRDLKGGLTRDGIYQRWQRILDKCGLPPVKLHALRHTSAVQALVSGVPIHMVRDQLGHSDIKTTEIYLRGDDPQRGDMYKNFGGESDE